MVLGLSTTTVVPGGTNYFCSLCTRMASVDRLWFRSVSPSLGRSSHRSVDRRNRETRRRHRSADRPTAQTIYLVAPLVAGRPWAAVVTRAVARSLEPSLLQKACFVISRQTFSVLPHRL